MSDNLSPSRTNNKTRFWIAGVLAVCFLVAYPVSTYTLDPSGRMAILGVPAIAAIASAYGSRVGMIAGVAGFGYTVLILAIGHTVLDVVYFTAVQAVWGTLIGILGYVGTGVIAGRVADVARLHGKTPVSDSDYSNEAESETIVTICAYCHRTRTEDDRWISIECFIQELAVRVERTEIVLSHGVCPDCRSRVYADIKRLD